jgi:hypothetical protein
MDLTTLGGWIQGIVVVLISSGLAYLAARKRDEPAAALAKEQLQVTRDQARDAGAKAASEAWAEYAERMEGRLDKAESKLEDTVAKLASCQAEQLRAKARIQRLEGKLGLDQ